MYLCYFLDANADLNNADDDDSVDVDDVYSDAPDTLMLPMFQVVQSMQRGKGLGRTKGRIKAVRKSSDPNDNDYAIENSFQDRLVLTMMILLKQTIKIAFKTDWY